MGQVPTEKSYDRTTGQIQPKALRFRCRRNQDVQIHQKTQRNEKITLTYHTIMNKTLPALLAAVLVCISASHGQSILLGGYDGNQTQNTIAPATITSSTGVRELAGAKEDAAAAGSVNTRIWTNQTTGKELQWSVTSQSTTTGNWGLSDFSTDASTANDRWVVTQQNGSWINFEITNTGTGDVTLDKFHISANRTSTGAPTTLTISLEDNGTFANPPVLSASDLTATGTQDIALSASTGWSHFEFALSSMLSDLTLAPGEKATFRIANNAGSARVYLDNIAISGSVISGPANPVDAGQSTVAAAPAAVLADGSSTSTITVTLKDSSGTPVAGEGVALAKTSGPGTPTISPSSTLTTNGVGVATFTVSSTTVGTEVFSATAVTDSVPVSTTASVEFQSTLVDAASSTVSASPTAVLADDTETSTITVTVRNSGGLPLPGKVVSLSGDGSASITTSNNTTNASGVVIFTVKSGTVGLETFTATSESVTIGTASVDFQTVPVAGPVNAGTTTVVASPTTVAGDGTTTSTITVTLKDAVGLAVANEGVTLAKTSGPGTPVISPAGAAITNASGVATFTVRSTTAGTAVFTATSQTDTVVVTQTASVTFTQVGAAFLVSLLPDPVSSSGSSSNSLVPNFYDGTETPASVGTTNLRGNAYFGVGVDSDGVSGTNAHIVVYDMGQVVSFDGFVHAQRKADGVDDVASIDFWVTNSNPGDASTTIPLPIFASQPTPNASVNLARNTGVLAEYLLPGGTLNGRYVVMRLNSARTSGANPGGFTLLLGKTAAVSDFDTWGSAYPGLGAAGADDDGDGLTNDEERIFGLNPQNGGSADPYAVPFDAATGTFSYTRRTQSITKLTYKIWYSTDLENWFWESGATQTPRAPVAQVEIVDVTIDPDLLTEPKLFLQVSAEDLGPPVVLSSLWGSNNTITLNFSEEMDAISATDPDNYSVAKDGGGSIAVSSAILSGEGKTVTLNLASPLAIDSAFTVTMDRIANGAGQPLGNGTAGQFRTWDNDPNGIKVFILAGQSNMVGYGHSELGAGNVAGAIGTLRYLAVNDATYPEYNYTSLLVDSGQPATSAWKTRGDVKVWGYNGASGNLPTAGDTPGKGDLGPPFQGANSAWFGPEYAFGQVIGNYYGGNPLFPNEPPPAPEQPVLIIKAAWGGHTLVGNFRPPSAVARVPGTQIGASYQEIFNSAREVLLNLDTEFPEWAGKGYQIVGFAWHQGTSDKAPTTVADEYKFNLPDLISDVRAEFGNPQLPFVIATTGMSNAGPVDTTAPYDTYHPVERAQLWDAAIAQPANTLTDDTRGYWEIAADSPTDQGFHWNHNARSYFRVGLGLGNKMVDLLTP
jgi:hypothetical protein